MKNERIANSWDLWCEYMDTNGEMTREEFDNLTESERLAQIVNCFGED